MSSWTKWRPFTQQRDPVTSNVKPENLLWRDEYRPLHGCDPHGLPRALLRHLCGQRHLRCAGCNILMIVTFSVGLRARASWSDLSRRCSELPGKLSSLYLMVLPIKGCHCWRLSKVKGIGYSRLRLSSIPCRTWLTYLGVSSKISLWAMHLRILNCWRRL